MTKIQLRKALDCPLWNHYCQPEHADLNQVLFLLHSMIIFDKFFGWGTNYIHVKFKRVEYIGNENLEHLFM